MDEELTKWDWGKIFREAKQSLRESMMQGAVARSTCKMAMEMIKNFQDDEKVKGKTEAPSQNK